MATTPNFVGTPNIGGANLSTVRISAANTALDGSGTLYTIITGGTNGTRVDRVNIKAIVTTTLGMIRFFLVDAAGNKRLLDEIPVSAIVASVSQPAFKSEWVRTDGQPLVFVPSGWFLKAATNNAESFDVVPVVAGDL